MAFEMICTGGPYGDCCSSYAVEFDKPCTVSDVVDFILSRGEWGNIEIDGVKVAEYKGSNLNHAISRRRLTKQVSKIRAHGGWSLMSFYIETLL